MKVAIDEVVHFDVVTHDPADGAVSDADSTPTFAVYEEATDTDIGVGGNLTKRTSLTGNYRGTFTASAANGFEAGKWYAVIASATVGAIAGKVVALLFQVVPAESVAGVPKVDVSHAAGVAWASGAIVAGALAGDAISAAKVAADVGTEIADAILTRQMTEAYAANGVAPTLAQALYAMHQMLSMFAISGTSLTVKKLDNATTAFIVTLNHATTPTGAART